MKEEAEKLALEQSRLEDLCDDARMKLEFLDERLEIRTAFRSRAEREGWVWLACQWNEALMNAERDIDDETNLLVQLEEEIEILEIKARLLDDDIQALGKETVDASTPGTRW